MEPAPRSRPAWLKYVSFPSKTTFAPASTLMPFARLSAFAHVPLSGEEIVMSPEKLSLAVSSWKFTVRADVPSPSVAVTFTVPELSSSAPECVLVAFSSNVPSPVSVMF